MNPKLQSYWLIKPLREFSPPTIFLCTLFWCRRCLNIELWRKIAFLTSSTFWVWILYCLMCCRCILPIKLSALRHRLQGWDHLTTIFWGATMKTAVGSLGGRSGCRAIILPRGGMRKRSHETHSQNSTVAANSTNRYTVYCEHKMCK